jgi:hypothetical protein
MPIPLPDKNVLEWLGVDSRGVPYYLNPLNLVWSSEGVEHDLNVFRQVAEKLGTDLNYWAEIIRAASWRHSLAGCTCLLVSSRHEFFEELSFRFREGSFIAPQIAVTLGLLHGSTARLFLESALDDPILRNRPKQAVAAHQVLLRLGAQPKHNITVEALDAQGRDDAMLADQVVAKHWEFWSGRIK